MAYRGMPGAHDGYMGQGNMGPGHGRMMAPDPSMVENYQHQHQHQPDMYPEESFHEGEFREVHSLPVDGGDRFGVSTVLFDNQEEFLWMGNSGGHVTSYYGTDMMKYTSFQIHARNDVRQMLTIGHNLLCLTRDNLKCNNKQGLHLFNYENENMQDMQCMLQTSDISVLMGGHQPKVMELDINTQQEIRKVEVSEPGCAIFKYAQNCNLICAGDTSGKVTLRAPDSLQSVHVLEAHTGTLSDFDVNQNQLVTCGFAKRMGNFTVDRYLMIYDLRMMRTMPPLQIHIDPMFLRFISTYTSRICVVSQSGHFQMLEQGAITPASMMMYQVNTGGSAISAFDISSTMQALAFGDSGGYLHLFTSQDPTIQYNNYSVETEFPTMESVHEPISINDQMTPLSVLPMQYPTNGTLLSYWPEHMCRRVYRKPKPIDPEILRQVKMVQNIGYAPNTGTKRRNQLPYKVKEGHSRERTTSVPDSPVGREGDCLITIPKRYRKTEIKYSKLGVEDFDFRQYNKTNYAGLETHIPNAYCNGMLQVLYFIEPLRVALLSHLCNKEFCLTCELAFLFHMLDQQKGKTCQANNFLRAFRTIPEAAALSLILGDDDENTGRVNMPRLIQSWNRFILQQVHSELVEAEKEKERQEKEKLESSPFQLRSLREGIKLDKSLDESDMEELNISQECGQGDIGANTSVTAPRQSIITDLFGVKVANSFQCSRCNNKSCREVVSTLFDLSYPEPPSEPSKPAAIEQHSFASVVQRSLSLEQITQAWCAQCDKYQPHVQRKSIGSLPNILALNCHLESDREQEFWRTQEALYRKAHPVMDTSRPQILAKPCRYGNACTRKDCKFRHESDHYSTPEPGVSFMDPNKLAEDPPESSWVPFGLRIELCPDGSLKAQDIYDLNLIPDQPDDKVYYYELKGTVAHVKEPKTGGGLVSSLLVGEKYHQRKEKVTCTQWYLFNDFTITPIEMNESTYFHLDWKVPCTLYYARKNLNSYHNLQVNSPIGIDVLCTNASLVTPRRKHVTFTPLDDEELPSRGDIVGLDAEFVTLNQEEAELRSDGTRSTIKPSQMSVARVTCVRGKGPLEGEPFIDDYISTQEQVVDYLTQFSGIKPGDLDASISSKHLTTLKCTYAKLRYLVDTGVVFVGHGLKKDFRVINLVIPKDQVIDTVELFHLPRQRMISLKFLAWFFLGINIQSVTHDSIEDAKTALKLHQKYQEMSAEGKDNFITALKDMYDKGRKLSWKIPEDGSSAASIAEELAKESTPEST